MKRIRRKHHERVFNMSGRDLEEYVTNHGWETVAMGAGLSSRFRNDPAACLHHLVDLLDSPEKREVALGSLLMIFEGDRKENEKL